MTPITYKLNVFFGVKLLVSLVYIRSSVSIFIREKEFLGFVLLLALCQVSFVLLCYLVFFVQTSFFQVQYLLACWF